jgi:hypothetical protein
VSDTSWVACASVPRCTLSYRTRTMPVVADSDVRKWGGGALVVAGVLACWMSSSTGFVIGGLLIGAGVCLLSSVGRGHGRPVGSFKL